jgi:hypothetical protein
MKEGKIIIPITKQEAEYLANVKNVKFGENGISHTYGHHRHYYLCENRYNLCVLKEYRKSQIAEK